MQTSLISLSSGGKKKVAAAAEGGGHGEGIGLPSAGGFFSFPLSGYDLGPRGTGGVAAPGRFSGQAGGSERGICTVSP